MLLFILTPRPVERASSCTRVVPRKMSLGAPPQTESSRCPRAQIAYRLKTSTLVNTFLFTEKVDKMEKM